MRAEKQFIIADLLERLEKTPYLLVVEYGGLDVTQFGELRNRLSGVGAQCHVTKNSYMRFALQSADWPEITDQLQGQTAFVTGEGDVCAAAKVLKNFAAEFEKPTLKGGVLDGKTLSPEEVKGLASLPAREILLAQLLGVLQSPATKLARILGEPGAALARVLQAKSEQG